MTKKGFTLVELLVAVAVFSVVMVVATSALLNVINANKKAQAIKTAIDNVNFALESISKDMRMGTGYTCLNDSGDATTCSSTGDVGVRYKSNVQSDGQDQYISYLYNAAANKIQKGIANSSSVTPAFVDITSSDVDITDMKFYVLTDGQPYVVITLSGEAGVQDQIKTKFDLQTSIAQRLRIRE